MSDIAVQDRPKPIRKEVRGKLRQALDLMIEEGITWQEAAKRLDYSVQSMRESFGRSHVLQYIKQRKQMHREAICMANHLRLAQIRDAADNMPAVQAIKLLEEMGEERSFGHGSSSANQRAFACPVSDDRRRVLDHPRWIAA
jgi:hypothetical protein